MTLHAAKGLEFGTVFLPGWEEGLFPHQRTLDESGRAGLEEERRLAYVGITRARKRRAKITFAQNRRIHGCGRAALPSRFIDELPEANVERGAEDDGLCAAMAPSLWRQPLRRAQAASPAAYDTPGWQRAQKRYAGGEATARAAHALIIEGDAGRRARRPKARRLSQSASACSTRNSAMAACRRSTATSSPSISTRPARSGWSTASSSRPDRSVTCAPPRRPRRRHPSRGRDAGRRKRR